MAALSTYGRQLVMNALLRGQSISGISAFLALYTSDPTDADIGTEVSGGNYARMPIGFSVPVDGATANAALITFPTATSAWGTAAYAGIRDASTGGHLLFHGPLTISEPIGTGDALEFLAGQITCTLA